jgi:hypothetical protein
MNISMDLFVAKGGDYVSMELQLLMGSLLREYGAVVECY